MSVGFRFAGSDSLAGCSHGFTVPPRLEAGEGA